MPLPPYSSGQAAAEPRLKGSGHAPPSLNGGSARDLGYVLEPTSSLKDANILKSHVY